MEKERPIHVIFVDNHVIFVKKPCHSQKRQRENFIQYLKALAICKKTSSAETMHAWPLFLKCIENLFDKSINEHTIRLCNMFENDLNHISFSQRKKLLSAFK